MAKTMVSPVEGYAGSRYGKRGSGVHLGLDIPGGGRSKKVYASFAGTIRKIVRGVRRGSKVSSAPDWAPGRTPNLVIIENPDGEFQLYGHALADARWSEGMKVEQGDYLGVTDLSGNTTGYHLHFEVWSSRRTTRNPEIDFRFFGVVIGSTPKGVNNTPKAWGAVPNPKPPTGKAPSSTVKSRLRKMGLPQSIAGVVAYQKAHGLFADGNWGSVTEKFYKSVVARQKYINTWRRVQPKLFVDGYWGAKSKKAESQAKAGATASVPYRPPAFAPKKG